MNNNHNTSRPLNRNKSADDLLRWARDEHDRCETFDEWKESAARAVLLSQFAGYHGLVKSSARPCSRKVESRTHRCNRACGQELQWSRFDHTSMWRNSNGEYVLLTEPYCRGGHVDAETADWLTEWCVDRGLYWFQSPLPSPYFPGATAPIVVSSADVHA